MNRFFKILPWLVIIVALGAAYSFHSANKTKDAELISLRPQAEEISQLKRENAELQKLPDQSDEVARLKKENADLLKLRNEARRLRDENKQMAGYLKNVQTKAQQAEARVSETEAQRDANLAAIRTAKQLEWARQVNESLPVASIDGQTNVLGACVKNLQLIDGAKQQWALENKKTELAVPTANDIAVYIKDGVPKCPAGGVYSINSVAVDPTCSIPGHQFPKQ